ncbi:hypothetical protein BGZ46_007255 [Entomortierella lignicola]|nr:hypothetical protein BGZ46_007255 [Entomortierella lignicola]
MPPIGTLMATNLQIWITPQDRPRPHPPNWRMDCVFRPQWTDPEQTLGHLEFIPSEERVQGYRSHIQLERNTNLGIFAAHPALCQALDVNGPLSLVDDLDTRINDVVVMRTKNITLGNAKTKHFRRVVFKASYPDPEPRFPPVHQPQQPLTANFWISFLDRMIPRNARNIWRRLLIGKLPSGARLHSIIPTIVAPMCRICQNDIESDQHLLFSCPKKLEVWQYALKKYISDQDWSAVLIESFFYPRPPTFEPLYEVPLFLLLGTILATIWKYHHAFIREDDAFNSSKVSAAVDIAVRQVIAQLAEKKKQEEGRNPPAPAPNPDPPPYS